MGAWGVRAFENDSAVDWTYELTDVDDLSAIERVFAEVEETGADYLELDVGADALAACEVLARLRGAQGYADPYTETVDVWVASHPLAPSPALVAQATAVIDRVLGPDSELSELWAEADGSEWREAVDELRGRLLA